MSVSYAGPSFYKATFEEISRRFEASYPDIKIELRVPYATGEEVLSDLLRSKVTGGSADIAFLNMNYIGLLVERGIARPLDSIVQDRKELDSLGYYPSVLSLGTVAGKLYGVPFTASLPVLHVNVDLVEQAGGTVDNFPTTWGGIADLGRKIAALDSHPVGFTFQYDGGGNWGLNALITSAGGRMDGANGCGAGFNTPEGRWAFETLEMFHNKGVPAMSRDQASQAFAAGRLGISAASGAFTVGFEQQAKGKFRYVTLPFPMKSEAGTLPSGGFIAIIAAKDPEKQRAAWEYIKFATSPEGQAIMVKNVGYLPVSQAAVEAPDFLREYYKDRRNQANQLSQMKHLSRWHSWPGKNGVKISSLIENHIDAVIGGTATAQQTVPKLVKGVEEMLPPCTAPN
ncbi:extracellular solute-binding protein [Bradyrhizobium sp. Arg62]|uniref:extracellular solute-binding protein n=1 Tax=Bradyrhizobium brasilense TaxID=1419277 RepID=UPI001E5908AE|nr:extracellular solute-binding protein [Bradyrhizobium brasilense]MCC8944231.1 extracellular solute-binding protein [Bradyrhizobium brasilense]